MANVLFQHYTWMWVYIYHDLRDSFTSYLEIKFIWLIKSFRVQLWKSHYKQFEQQTVWNSLGLKVPEMNDHHVITSAAP